MNENESEITFTIMGKINLFFTIDQLFSNEIIDSKMTGISIEKISNE